MKECCGEARRRSVVVKCVEKCCEGMLWSSVVKECCGEVL